MLKRCISTIAILLCVFLLVSCNNSSVNDAIDDADDLINGPDRKQIDVSKTGVNAFVNDSRFGSISSQFNEVRNQLGLSYVRILFNWDNNVQPNPGSEINFSFYDSIASQIPEGVDALVILTGVPSWMGDSANWVDGNPRKTFAERFVRRAVRRYANNPRIIGWQIWNEPNMLSNNDNQLLDIAQNPENYVEMLALSHSIAKSLAPNKLVVNAATTAINQNFPESLDYNQRMVDAGAESFLDRYAVHYYGKQFENLVRPGGVADFLNGRAAPKWVTESGAQGVNSQLAYGEQVWPYLTEEVPSIERIYIYQFTEATPADQTYGLKNLSTDAPVSDLYISLRDR